MYFHEMIRVFSLILISVIFSSSCYSKGYEIKFKVDGIQNEEVILAHYFNKSIYPDDTSLVVNGDANKIYPQPCYSPCIPPCCSDPGANCSECNCPEEEPVPPRVKDGTLFWTISSDARLKKNIRVIPGALDKILQLRGVTFEWKEPEKHANRTGMQIGL